MGPMSEPFDRHDEAGLDEDAGQTRHDWFASALDDEWQADGDGIYRFVPQATPGEAPPHVPPAQS